MDSNNNYLNIFNSKDMYINNSKKIANKRNSNKLNYLIDINYEKKYYKFKNSIIFELKEILKEYWLNTIWNKNNKLNFLDFFIFGSRANDLDLEEDDIDLILVVNNKLDFKIDFFDKIENSLKEFNNINNEKIYIINKIENIHLPLLKLEFKNIDFDIVFCNLTYKNYLKIKNNYSIEAINNIKFNNKQVKVMDAYKNILFIKEILIKYPFLKKFIKLIKLWAKLNGLYSFNYCFLNGISITILCIKIFYLYPNYSMYYLFERFFFIYSEFPFCQIPINISKYNNELDDNYKNLPIKILSPFDSNIITTFSFTKSTLNIMKEHMRFIRNFCYSNINNYDKCIFRYPFFDNFDYFLEIFIKSENYIEYKKYKSFVEANLKNLIYSLENNFKNLFFRPWPFTYDIFSKNACDDNINNNYEELDTSFFEDNDFKSNMEEIFENNVAISKISNIDYYKGYIYFGLKENIELKQIYNLNQFIENWKVNLDEKNIYMYYNGDVEFKIISKNQLKEEVIEKELQIIEKLKIKY